MNPLDIEIYLTVTETAQRLSMSKEEVRELVRIGVIIPYKANPNDTRYLIPESEVMKLLHNKVH